MWTELFLDNPDALAFEIDGLMERLSEYSRALKDRDDEKLHEMLRTGREQKAAIDKEVF